jgi:hypothetical protein
VNVIALSQFGLYNWRIAAHEVKTMDTSDLLRQMLSDHSQSASCREGTII